MIKIYDQNHNYLCFLDIVKDGYTEEELAKGWKSFCFKAPQNDYNISVLKEENYVESADYVYVIKEVSMRDNMYIEVRCYANIEEIRGRVFLTFDCFEQSLQQAYQYCINGLGWTLDYQSENKSEVTYQLPNTDSYSMLQQIAEDYQQELWFDTKNKVLSVYDQMGKEQGTYYSNELRLKQLNKQSSSYDYCTILYPFGKDGLTIEEINNGRAFIENFSYTNKQIAKIVVNDKMEYREDLKAWAEGQLAEMAVPRCSYKLTLSTLGDVGLGDQIMIVDNLKKIKQKQRVVKIKRYLEQPEKSTVEISNLQENFARDYIKQTKNVQKKLDYLNSVVAGLVKNS